VPRNTLHNNVVNPEMRKHRRTTPNRKRPPPAAIRNEEPGERAKKRLEVCGCLVVGRSIQQRRDECVSKESVHPVIEVGERKAKIQEDCLGMRGMVFLIIERAGDE